MERDRDPMVSEGDAKPQTAIAAGAEPGDVGARLRQHVLLQPSLRDAQVAVNLRVLASDQSASD